MTTQASPSSAALRSKRYRERRRDGVIVVTLEVFGEDIETLVELGLLKEDEQGDRGKIASATSEFFDYFTAGVFDLNEEALDEYLQGDE